MTEKEIKKIEPELNKIKEKIRVEANNVKKLTYEDLLPEAYDLVNEIDWDKENPNVERFKEQYLAGDIGDIIEDITKYDVNDPQGLIDALAESTARIILNVKNNFTELENLRKRTNVSV